MVAVFFLVLKNKKKNYCKPDFGAIVDVVA